LSYDIAVKSEIFMTEQSYVPGIVQWSQRVVEGRVSRAQTGRSLPRRAARRCPEEEPANAD
jgi:hypothetical protein